MTTKWALLGAGLSALAFWTVQAAAEDTPRIEGEILIEFQNDYNYESDDSDNELNDLFNTTEADFSFFATDEFYLNTLLVFEPVEDTDPEQNRFFGDQGAYVEVLTINWETDSFFVLAGKFGPNFSIAYDAAPGIYGTELAEDDIELSERLGFSAGVAFGESGIPLGIEGIGRQELSASVFVADTSFFSNSVFEERGQLNRDEGGPSNTRGFESFTLALDGYDFPQAEGLRYQLAVAKQGVDTVLDDDGNEIDNTADEYRFGAAAEWAIGVTEDITVTPLLEYVHFWNGGGIDGEDRDYVTASTLFEYQNWNLALAYTGRFIENDEGEDIDDYQFQVSAGYTFDFGLEASIGWKIREEDEVDTETFGALLAYSFAF